MNGVWKTWMTAWCWFTLAFGALLAAAALPGLGGPALLFYDIVSLGSLPDRFIDAPAFRFTLGVLGGVMVGWAIAIFGMLKAAETASHTIWTWLTGSMIVWFVVDSALSVATGFWMNGVTNGVFLVGYLIPVLASGVLSGRSTDIAGQAV